MSLYKNILIIRTDRIGDVVLTTPAIRALRKAFPQARLTMLIAPATKDLVVGNPFIDEVMIDDRKDEHKGPLGFIRLIQAIRKKKFDLAINFHTKKRTNLLCFLAGIPNRVAYKNNKFGFLLTHPIADDRPLGIKHEAQYCLDVLKVLGVESNDLELFVPLQKEAEEWAEKYFYEKQLDRSQAVFAIQPGASCLTRIWPAKRFSELIHVLVDKYLAEIILVGGMDNKAISQEILGSVDVPVLDLTGKISIAQLASLFKRCHLLVSNDTGPVHIAAAVGTPVVSIFTRSQPGINPERWRPLGEKSRVVVTPFKGEMSFAKSGVTDPAYLELIKTEDVVEAVDAIFRLC